MVHVSTVWMGYGRVSYQIIIQIMILTPYSCPLCLLVPPIIVLKTARDTARPSAALRASSAPNRIPSRLILMGREWEALMNPIS